MERTRWLRKASQRRRTTPRKGRNSSPAKSPSSWAFAAATCCKSREKGSRKARLSSPRTTISSPIKPRWRSTAATRKKSEFRCEIPTVLRRHRALDGAGRGGRRLGAARDADERLSRGRFSADRRDRRAARHVDRLDGD